MKTKTLKIVALLAVTLAFSACTDANRSKLTSFGAEHEIYVYSGGTVVKQYTSTGKPASEHQSDGYYFVNKATGKIVLVSGTVVFEQK